jgi:hypothetical protein
MRTRGAHPFLRAATEPTVRKDIHGGRVPLNGELGAGDDFVQFAHRRASVHAALLSPGTLGLWVTGEEVPQHHKEFACVLFVTAPERVMDVVADHVANFLGPVW